jgi:hypothetical protein
MLALGLAFLAPAAKLLFEARLMLAAIFVIIPIELLHLALAKLVIMRIVEAAAAIAAALAALLGVAEDGCAARRASARAASRIAATDGCRHRMRALCADMAGVHAIEAPAGVVKPAEAGAAPSFGAATTAAAAE